MQAHTVFVRDVGEGESGFWVGDAAALAEFLAIAITWFLRESRISSVCSSSDAKMSMTFTIKDDDWRNHEQKKAKIMTEPLNQTKAAGALYIARRLKHDCIQQTPRRSND